MLSFHVFEAGGAALFTATLTRWAQLTYQRAFVVFFFTHARWVFECFHLDGSFIYPLFFLFLTGCLNSLAAIYGGSPGIGCNPFGHGSDCFFDRRDDNLRRFKIDRDSAVHDQDFSANEQEQAATHAETEGEQERVPYPNQAVIGSEFLCLELLDV